VHNAEKKKGEEAKTYLVLSVVQTYGTPLAEPAHEALLNAFAWD